MTVQCSIEHNLCPIVRGDTVPFVFRFKFPDGSPLDISGLILFFSMKKDPDGDVVDLQKRVVFPNDVNSKAGIGWLKLNPVDTNPLEPLFTYHYDFQVVTGSREVYTMGLGTVLVKRDITRVAI